MSHNKQRRRGSRPPNRENRLPESPPRIIGGRFRGRLLEYHGDLRTRPMKDRTRQAVFDLLGPAVKAKHAIDLFAGTGALGLEALSRGAAGATLIENHFPTARVIRQNVEALQVEDRTRVVAADAFIWARRGEDFPERPWVVFCSPPYDFYVDRSDDMLRLIGTLLERSPVESLLVVESDERFDVAQLPHPHLWDVRRYAPAVIAVYERSLP